jgi:RNA polymerase sigma-70 factor, ECF subfamily
MENLFTLQSVPRRAARPATGALHILPDASLVHETRLGNENAFGELMRRYQERVYTILYGMIQNREDALDLTQEVFVKAYVGLRRFGEAASFYTWLYRIAVNACIDFNRGRKRTPSPVSLEDELLIESPYEPVDERPDSDPERVLAAKEMREHVMNAIDTLTEPFRAAVLLRDVQGLSLEEAAEILRCPPGTVKSRLHRARGLLRQQLAPILTGAGAWEAPNTPLGRGAAQE